MRKFSALFVILLIITLPIFAQTAPQKINYQTVVRNAAGAPVVNQNVSLRFSILTGSAGGATVYSETQSVTTNAFGLANVQIGGGTPVSGTFATIAWGTASKFLKIEADITGGSTYTNLSTVEMVSVPYAQYASTAATAAPTGAAGGNLTGTYPNPTIANNAVTNAKISSGAATNGQVLTADGSGNTVWQTAAAGGSNTVGFSAYLSFYPLVNTSFQINGWDLNPPSYNDGNFNALTGLYTVPSSGIYTIAAVVNYQLTVAVAANVGPGILPTFEIRTVTPPIVLATGFMPFQDINMTIPMPPPIVAAPLAIRAPLEAATVTIIRTLALAAGDQVGLYYNNDGLNIPFQLFNNLFMIKKL